MTTNTDKMHPQFWLYAEAGYGETDVQELENNGVCPGDLDGNHIRVGLSDYNRAHYGDDGHHSDEPMGWVNWAEVSLTPEQDAVIFSLAVDSNESPEADFQVKVFRGTDGKYHMMVSTT